MNNFVSFAFVLIAVAAAIMVFRYLTRRVGFFAAEATIALVPIGVVVGLFLSYFFQPDIVRAFLPIGDYFEYVFNWRDRAVSQLAMLFAAIFSGTMPTVWFFAAKRYFARKGAVPKV